MTYINCGQCLYGEHCTHSGDCEYYLPLCNTDVGTTPYEFPSDEDLFLDQYIESQREAYRLEWFAYLSDDEPPDDLPWETSYLSWRTDKF